MLQQFEPEQEWVLETGDMLYLPPNVAHHGVALEPGMTWSIGSRAPSGADLLQGLGEWLAFSDDEGGRYSDPHLKATHRAGEIDTKELERLRNALLNCMDEREGLNNYFAAFLSRFRLAHDPLPPPELLTSEDLLIAIKNGAGLMRNPWTRLTWIENQTGARLYAAGQAYGCSISLAEFLCEWEQPGVSVDMLDQASAKTLTDLINNGHFILTDSD